MIEKLFSSSTGKTPERHSNVRGIDAIRPIPVSTGEIATRSEGGAVTSTVDTNSTVRDAIGVQDSRIALQLILQMANLEQKQSGVDEKIADAFTMLQELKPANATESLLVVQMYRVHQMAVGCMQSADVDNFDLNLQRATKLSRLFIDQLAALQKLKGTSGQQRVTIEHVHVNDGGQAIVATIAPGKDSQRGSRG